MAISTTRYHQVIIPGVVYQELADIDPPVPGTLEAQSADWLQVRQVTDLSVIQRLQNEARLDPGESEAIPNSAPPLAPPAQSCSLVRVDNIDNIFLAKVTQTQIEFICTMMAVFQQRVLNT